MALCLSILDHHISGSVTATRSWKNEKKLGELTNLKGDRKFVKEIYSTGAIHIEGNWQGYLVCSITTHDSIQL